MLMDRSKLQELGKRLRAERLKRNDLQAAFAVRVGVSVPTLHKMELGDPTVQIGAWVNALEVLNRLDDLDALLQPSEDLFAKYEQSQVKERKRASRRKTP